jgi:glycosyltransferase involved in cell wall biosynthesis
MGTGCVIGFVGGFYPWHGLSLLVEAMVILKKQKQDVNCLLIGDGPELAKIKSKIAQLGLENYFTFPGRIAHHELARYVEQFDIGIMPDSNNYGSPMKLFEYMAAGIPFVAADYSPIVEITTNQGELFEKKNVVSFAQALIKYTNNESIRVNAGAKGRQKVEQYFNWEKNASRTVLHLQKCIELKNNV